MKKVITYSLWCQQESFDKNNKNQNPNFYCQGALKNIKLQQEGIYKDWTMRFYIDNTVPIDIVQKIKCSGAEIIDMTGTNIPGMFWRFLVINDNTVDLFIVRDIDSRINAREEKAVIKWIESNKDMHVIRDHPHHYYKILGGMWGLKNKSSNPKTKYIRGNFMNLLTKFLENKNYKFKRMDDMIFLDQLYFIMKDNILGHDNFFNFPENEYFPGENNDNTKKYYKFVGEIIDANDIPSYLKRDVELFKNYKKIMKHHFSSKFWK